MRIELIGAGRVATQMGLAFREAGHEIAMVYSRSEGSAKALANLLSCEYTTQCDGLVSADVALFMVSDAALPSLIERLCPTLSSSTLCLHTAGSLPMTLFEGKAQRYGVLYPMQTFSKERRVCFREIPCYIEASDKESLESIRLLAESISDRVRPLAFKDRLYLHLAAVFASNMANHCYHIAQAICREHGIDFTDLAPLISETAAKIKELTPHDAQTGPAVRADHNVMEAQMHLLDAYPEAKEIYRLMSNNIERMHRDDKL